MASLSREFVRHEFDDLRRELGDVRSLLRELAVRTRNVEAASSNVVDDLAALGTRGEFSAFLASVCFVLNTRVSLLVLSARFVLNVGSVFFSRAIDCGQRRRSVPCRRPVSGRVLLAHDRSSHAR